MEQISYKKLFKLLIDKDLKKTEFAAKAGSHLHMIREQGMEAAMKAVLAEGKV